MAAVLALLSAVAWGAADFVGGLTTRRLPAPAVVLWSHVIGLVGLAAVAVLLDDADLVAEDAAWGAAGGIAGGIAVLLLYRGLATGTMSVVAPVTAVLSAVVPVGVGLAGGERPTFVALVGVPIALAAVLLLAREPRDGDERTHGMTRAALATALGAGLGFGLFFVALDAASDDAGLWPLVSGRAASVLMFGVVAVTTASARVPVRRLLAGSIPLFLLTIGVVEVLANALFLLATQRGLLTLVSVLGALYPASTLLLARAILGERLARSQLTGVLLAGGAVVLVTAG